MEPSQRPIKVLVAEDRPEIRRLLRRIIGQERSLELVGEAENGAQAIDCVRELAPDVVVMDVEMPVVGGVEATRVIKERWPEVQVLAFTGVDDDEVLAQLAEAGASAHLLKTRASELLAPVIAAIAAPLESLEAPGTIFLDAPGATVFDGPR